MSMIEWRRTLEPWLLPVALLALWEALARGEALPRFLSSPSAIAAAIASLCASGDYVGASLISLWRAYAGFCLGAASGALLGLGAALFAPLRALLDSLVAFLFPVPKIAFLPVFLLLFGYGDLSKIMIIALSVFFPLFVVMRRAALSVDQNLVWAARNMGAGRLSVLWRVILPAVRPQLFAGLRVGLALAFIILFAAEVIGSRAGLGFLILEAENGLQFDEMLAGIVGFAILGFLSDRLLMACRGWVLRGQMLGTAESAPS